MDGDKKIEMQQPKVGENSESVEESNKSGIFHKNELIDNDDIIIDEDKDKEKYNQKNEEVKICDNHSNLPESINENGAEEIQAVEKNNEVHIGNIKENQDKKNNPMEYDENGKKMGKAKKYVHQKLKVPPRLFKTFIVTTILALLGIVLIILGCIEEIAEKTPGRGIMFWVLGGIVIIPGGYYSYQFYKAKTAKNEFQRDDIFEDIPEL
ncbi:MAG: transmembrane domain-containing protein [archaeon]|nr:transmembrane domain-containing protein [archaeon]